MADGRVNIQILSAGLEGENESDRRQLAARLREARKAAGLSMRTVSEQANLGSSTLCRWEAAERSPSALMLHRLARIYQRPIAWFFLAEDPSAAQDALLVKFSNLSVRDQATVTVLVDFLAQRPYSLDSNLEEL